MGKKLQTLYVIWYREVLIYLRNTLKFFTSIFLPLLILIFFGTGLKTMFPVSALHYDFSQFFFPGILCLSVSIMAISSTMSIVWDREFGFLKEILVSPISRPYIALGKILGATTTALIQGTLWHGRFGNFLCFPFKKNGKFFNSFTNYYRANGFSLRSFFPIKKCSTLDDNNSSLQSFSLRCRRFTLGCSFQISRL